MRPRVARRLVAKQAPAVVTSAGLVTVALVGTLALYAALRRVVGHAAGRARDDFVVATAHDLKNPLTAIRGQVHLLRRGVERLPGVQMEQRARLLTRLRHIDAAMGRTLVLLDELLDAVRREAEQSLDLVMRPTDLVALARQVAATYQASTERHRIVVQADA